MNDVKFQQNDKFLYPAFILSFEPRGMAGTESLAGQLAQVASLHCGVGRFEENKDKLSIRAKLWTKNERGRKTYDMRNKTNK